MSKQELKKQLAVLEILNDEIPLKHPKGSTILFMQNYLFTMEQRDKYSCCWYDMVGIGFPLKNLVTEPPDWQNISREEAVKICEPFDKRLIMEPEKGPTQKPNE